MFNVIDFDEGWKVDLIIRKDRPFSVEEFRRRQTIPVLGRSLPVASAEDVILAKLEWNSITPSERQLKDAFSVILAQAARLEIAPVVRFRGAVPHDTLPAIYRSGTLFVLSSRHEAQGMAALEAAACGLPAVGAGVGVIPELAPQAAIAVPSRDSEALADALAAVLNDRERRCALGRAARARVEAEFGLHRSVERFRQVYASLAGRG